jgi:hypothetical protein
MQHACQSKTTYVCKKVHSPENSLSLNFHALVLFLHPIKLLFCILPHHTFASTMSQNPVAARIIAGSAKDEPHADTRKQHRSPLLHARIYLDSEELHF